MTTMPTKTLAALAAALLLLAGCSEPQGTEPGEAAAEAEAGSGNGASSDPGDAGGKAGGGKGNGSGPGKKGGSNGSGGGSGGGPGGGGSSGNSGPGGGSSGGGSGSSSLAAPAAGRYTYSQKGFERFCQGPSCDKQQLPPTQTVDASVESQSSDSVTVVTRAQTSDRQTLTTTTRYTGATALITKVVIDFAYGSFNFSQTYEPQPPVESLRFPMEVGESWRGRWDARTSGDYSIRVVDSASGPGGTMFKLVTVTNFKGDFVGRAQATLWVDGDTGIPVRTDGDIAVASSFGEYTSSFTTTLQGGPGF